MQTFLVFKQVIVRLVNSKTGAITGSISGDNQAKQLFNKNHRILTISVDSVRSNANTEFSGVL
ncbi:hypothetical protein OUZ56_015794 [Daphnia magna]|uniref:Uncharacterized protein n=1 Tax=Daphnia magna TaxID=35525 RepID=A0ABR0ANS2_9CRUS|nr:hypothetical protein OUZ56_015794 [Daphnia magna]